MASSKKQLEGLSWLQQYIIRITLELLPSFKLVNSVSSTYTTTKLFHNEYWVPYPSLISCLKGNFTIWQNWKVRGLQKPQFPKSLVNWEIFGSTKLMFKNPSFPFLCKQLGSTAEDQDSKAKKSQFWIYWWIGKIYVQI